MNRRSWLPLAGLPVTSSRPWNVNSVNCARACRCTARPLVITTIAIAFGRTAVGGLRSRLSNLTRLRLKSPSRPRQTARFLESTPAQRPDRPLPKCRRIREVCPIGRTAGLLRACWSRVGSAHPLRAIKLFSRSRLPVHRKTGVRPHWKHRKKAHIRMPETQKPWIHTLPGAGPTMRRAQRDRYRRWAHTPHYRPASELMWSVRSSAAPGFAAPHRAKPGQGQIAPRTVADTDWERRGLTRIRLPGQYFCP